MIVSSIISLTGHPNKDNLISLPFSLGDVVTADFYAISIIIISVVSIAYSSAQIQGLRARNLIQKLINELSSEDKWITNSIHVKDFVDSVLNPTFNRVAPISQFLLGGFIEKDSTIDNRNKILKRIIGAILYVILKALSFLFMYLIPTYAIFKSWKGIQLDISSHDILIPNVLNLIIVIIAVFSLTVVLLGEFNYTKRAIHRIMRPFEKDN